MEINASKNWQSRWRQWIFLKKIPRLIFWVITDWHLHNAGWLDAFFPCRIKAAFAGCPDVALVAILLESGIVLTTGGVDV